MLDVEERQEVDVRKELARRSRFVRATGRRSWNARPDSEGDADIHVQSTDDWLLLTSSAHDTIAHLARQAEGAWKCLLANREFDGGAKIVLRADANRLGVAAEIPCSEEEPDLELQLGAAFLGMVQAGRWRPGSVATQRAEPAAVSPDLANLCKMAGWTCNERADGSASVSLETQESTLLGGGGLALVEHDATRGVMVRVEMLSSKEADLTTPIRLAIARMLLTAGGLVRFARPIAWNGESRIKAGFEVVLGSTATPARLGWALCALSVAWQLCGREIHALAFQAIAEAFLEANRPTRGE